MKIKINKEIRGDVTILSLSGNLLGGPVSYERLPVEFKTIIEGDVKKVVIDLENVKRMNSTGLGILMRCYMSLKRADGELKLVGLGDTLKGILIMTKLNTIFTTHQTLEEALNNFGSSRIRVG